MLGLWLEVTTMSKSCHGSLEVLVKCLRASDCMQVSCRQQTKLASCMLESGQLPSCFVLPCRGREDSDGMCFDCGGVPEV